MTEIKARTTMYKGIRMRSRLEADFASFLDRVDAEWEYEPVCFAGPDGQWLPDFRVLSNGKRIYFEIKSESLSDDAIDPTLERMTVVWLTEPDAILHLTIWRFGEPERSVSFMGIPREPDDDFTWWYAEGSGSAWAWPGMGQLEECVERARQEDDAAREIQ